MIKINLATMKKCKNDLRYYPKSLGLMQESPERLRALAAYIERFKP